MSPAGREACEAGGGAALPWAEGEDLLAEGARSLWCLLMPTGY